MPARHALKMIDDRPIHIFVAKLGENPAGWAVPVQRVLTILKPLQALKFSRRCLSTPRSAPPRTLHGNAARVALRLQLDPTFHSSPAAQRWSCCRFRGSL